MGLRQTNQTNQTHQPHPDIGLEVKHPNRNRMLPPLRVAGAGRSACQSVNGQPLCGFEVWKTQAFYAERERRDGILMALLTELVELMGTMTIAAAALRAELEAAILSDVERLGLDKWSKDALVKRFMGR